jgi:hypothetical protein
MYLTTGSPTYYVYPDNQPGMEITITCAELQKAIDSARSLGHTPCRLEDHYENKFYFLNKKGKITKIEEKFD